MEELLCISPIDGRYHKTTEKLNQFFSEYALIKYRVLVEIKWLLKLDKTININFSEEELQDQLRSLGYKTDKYVICRYNPSKIGDSYSGGYYYLKLYMYFGNIFVLGWMLFLLILLFLDMVVVA